VDSSLRSPVKHGEWPRLSCQVRQPASRVVVAAAV